MRYIINSGGYYFSVSQDVSMPGAPYPGCQHFSNKDAMMAAVAAAHTLDIEDLEESDMKIAISPHTGHLICTDDRCTEVKVDDLRSYILEFEL